MTRAGPTVIAFALSALAGAGAMRAEQQAQAATRREPQFENDQVRVWKSIIQPKQPLTLHRHEHGRARIALVGGTLSVVDTNGTPIETYAWQSGKAYWLEPDPPGQLHADVNRTTHPIEVVVVELQHDR